MDEEILSKKLPIKNKMFFFDLKSNPNGVYLKITEKVGINKHFIIIPDSGVVEFRNMINEIIESQNLV